MILTSDTTLSEDHTGPIIIASNDITLDCGGHTVSGSFPDTGILVEGRTGVTVKNCHVAGFAAGIRLRGAYQNTLASNLLVSNTNGVDLLQYRATTHGVLKSRAFESAEHKRGNPRVKARTRCLGSGAFAWASLGEEVAGSHRGQG